MSQLLFSIKMLLALGVITLVETNHFFTTTQANPLPNLVPAPSLQQEETVTKNFSNQTALPFEVRNAVLANASKQTNQTVDLLRIIDAQRRTWSDGCLGLAEPDRLCLQVLTPGWQVIVNDGQRNLVYRTNSLGNLVKLAELPQ